MPNNDTFDVSQPSISPSTQQRELPALTKESWKPQDAVPISVSDPAEQQSRFTPENILVPAGMNSSHIVGPAIVDDSDTLEMYLSSIHKPQSTSVVRSTSNVDPPHRMTRPVLFNAVLSRPLGTIKVPNAGPQKCEIIERFLEPNAKDVVALFFSKVNSCFPILDEEFFQKLYLDDRDKISPALLSNLYANALVYWNGSKALRIRLCPDIRFIWVQANEALQSELWLSPGISTIIAILLNVLGRPSTSMFGNGGMIGTAVALSNAMGLNRDSSSWNISQREKSLRTRMWWLVVIHDRWCSLAYGTPLHINHAQHDVPLPSLLNIHTSDAVPSQTLATSIFIALVTLTEVLGSFLEHIYHISKTHHRPATSPVDLELMMSRWEGELTDELRRIVLRGTRIQGPGASNLRIAYLAVKLLLRRIQLDLDKTESQTQLDTQSQYFFQAQRASEEIVHFVQELDEANLRDFWLPVHAFTFTSATTFLLKSALRSDCESPNQSPQYRIAKDMLEILRRHRREAAWDLADNCIDKCADIVEKIGRADGNSDLDFTFDQDFLEWMNLDLPGLDRFVLDQTDMPLTDGND